MPELSRISESEEVIVPRQTRQAAAIGVWYLWIIGVVGFLASVYFFTHPETWSINAEQFYVLIFASASFLSLLAGVYTIYSRPKLST